MWYWEDLCYVIQVQIPVRVKRIGVNNNCLAITHRAAEKRLQPRFATFGGRFENFNFIDPPAVWISNRHITIIF